jgi:hypothetical protein
MERLASDWDIALLTWRDQDLALFARRAHAQLGRGFVLVDRDDPTPVYVTEVAGPEQLIEAVFQYNPQEEALLVSDDSELDAVVISLVKIQKVH